MDYPGLLLAAEYPTHDTWDVLNRARNFSSIDVPMYLAGNWTDPGLHLVGNIRAFNNISSKEKWLEIHTGNHLAALYDPSHMEHQEHFLDSFLMGKAENGMSNVPRIRLVQHHGTQAFYREHESSFPPPDVEEVALYLGWASPDEAQVALEYQGLAENLKFNLGTPFPDSFEILGSPYLELDVVTEAQDFDLFIYLRAIDRHQPKIITLSNHGESMDSFDRSFFRLSHRMKSNRVSKRKVSRVN